MIRVLQVYPQMNNAGTERVILNLYENIDRDQVQFDFLTQRPGQSDETIRSYGGKIFYIYEKNRQDYCKALDRFFQTHPEYRIVHTHTHERMDLVLKMAKKNGVICRIAHSHNARNDLPAAAAFLKGIKSLPIEQYANCFFACSQNAAKWLFPHKAAKCRIIYNAIALEEYFFSEEARILKRTELGIAPEDFVMIHVGRFAEQKNHRFLMEILRAYDQNHPGNWKMLLAGDGPLMEEIKERAEAYHLTAHILFLNERNDIDQLLSASDLFLLPSLHEGLGIAAIEAQASELPCIVSDAVPPEADLEIGLLKRLSLSEPAQCWADRIWEAENVKHPRGCSMEKIQSSHYNIHAVAAQMQRFYLRYGK